MKSVLPVAIVIGVVAGLFVGGFYNVFNVPVMEWAITLEEAASEAEAAANPAPPGPEEPSTDVSLGLQRIGMVFGIALIGVIFGGIFTGLYHLVRLTAPGWSVWAWASIAAVLGFWAISLFSQIKYPLNPPGIGEDVSLLARQGSQFLFIALSLLAVVAGSLLVRAVNQSGSQGFQRFLGYAGVAVAYGVVMTVVFVLIPGNPDPIPEWVPDPLVIMFRALTLIGHLLLWMVIAFGVVGYLEYNRRGIKADAPAQGHPVNV